MAKIVLKDKWMKILLGAILIIAGLIIVIFGIVQPGVISMTLSIVFAVSLFFIGALYLYNGLSKTANANVIDLTYIIAAIAISLGVVLLVNTNLIANILVYIVSISVLTIGSALLIRGIVLCARKSTASNCVLAIIVGVVLIVLGVLALIFQSQITQVIYISSGVLLLIVGILQIVDAVRN